MRPYVRCMGVLALACCGAAFAKSYPSKAVRMIVPFIVLHAKIVKTANIRID